MADDSERRGLEALIRVAGLYKTTARALLGMAWVADGLSATEADFLKSLARLTNASVAERVVALPWVADGISDTEASVISSMGGIDSWSAAVAESVIALPWVADGMSDTKADSISSLWVIAFRDADAALQVVGMPFLQTLEGADVEALHTLAGRSADELEDLLSLPTLKDGITDDDAPVIALIGREPDVVDKALAPDSTMVERRTVDLPLAGEVDLVIVRTRPNARRGMDLFENTVREAENLMGEPFPARYRYIGLNYIGRFGGSYRGSGVTDGISAIYILSEFDEDDSRWGRRILAHEVAHYYWRGNADWIDEGMAELMELVIENRRVGTPIDFTRRPCEFARNLKELEELAPRKGTPAFICNYSLGEGLFVSLLRTLGEDAFWEGARRLYAASLDSDGGAGIEEVRQAFGPDAIDVINHWYEGS